MPLRMVNTKDLLLKIKKENLWIPLLQHGRQRVYLFSYRYFNKKTRVRTECNFAGIFLGGGGGGALSL